MMKYLTRPAEPKYEQVAMVGKIKKGADLIKKLVKKGEAPKTDVDKVKAKVEADKKNIQELADEGQIPVKSDIPEPFAGKFEEEFMAHDNMFGRRSGDNKVDAQEIAEQVAEARGQDYYDLGYKEQMDLYDKAYNYLGLLDRTKDAMKEATGRTLQAEGGRIEMSEGGSVKASELSKLLKEAGIEVSPKNIGRFTKTYGINKDPSRPAESGFYKKPTKKQLEKIKKDYDKKILKATGSTEAGKEAFEKREVRAKQLLKEGRTQTEANEILKKEFDVKSMKSTLGKVSKELKKEGVKVKSGREAEVKTPGSKFSKERLKLQKATSDPYIEKKIRESKKAAGFGDIDLAHRASMKQNKRLGSQLLSDTLGLDPPEVNRKIIKPVENKLEKLYKKQSSLVNKIKKEGPSKELRLELEKINNQVEDVARATKGRLQAIVVDPYNLKPVTLGIDYSKAFGAGVVEPKPVSKLTPYDIELGTMQMKGQTPAVTKLYSGISPELSKLSYEILKDVAKGIPTPLGTVGLNVGLGVDPTSSLDRAAIGAELALAPELVRQSARFGPTTQRILNLGLKAAPAMRIARLATPVGIATLGAEGAYQFYKALEKEKARIAAMSPEERQKFEEEQTAAAYMGEAGGYADGGRVEFKKGGMDRRTFIKLMGGLASLPIVGKFIKPAAKVAPAVSETIARTSENIPVYMAQLINKIKSIGKSKTIGKPDNPEGFVQYDLEDYTLVEGPGYTRVSKTEYGASSQGEGIKNQLEVEIKKDPETGALEYDEFTVSPDAEGKLKDVDFGIEDMDHKVMEDFANE